MTNVNTTVVHNVYNRTEIHNTTIVNRVSYNGGRGGINTRPSGAELAVLHERRTAPVEAQTRHAREMAGNRAQFASTNHGHPPVAAIPHPLATAYRSPAAQPALMENRPEPSRMEEHHSQPNIQPDNHPATHPAPAHQPEERRPSRSVPQNRPASRPHQSR